MNIYVSDKQLAKRFDVNRITIWRWRKSDLNFPSPIKLSPGTTRWKLEDIEKWLANKQLS